MPFHWAWLLLIVVILLIVFGAGKLGSVGGVLGRSVREFRQEVGSERDGAANTPEPTGQADRTDLSR